jgi:hypothetical protein
MKGGRERGKYYKRMNGNDFRGEYNFGICYVRNAGGKTQITRFSVIGVELL